MIPSLFVNTDFYVKVIIMSKWFKVIIGSILGGFIGWLFLPPLMMWICHAALRSLGGPNHYGGPDALWEIWIQLNNTNPQAANVANMLVGALLGAITSGGIILFLQQQFVMAKKVCMYGGATSLLFLLLLGLNSANDYAASGGDWRGVIFDIGVPVIWSGLILLWGIFIQRKVDLDNSQMAER